ncbi:hypothetical protein MMC30_002806 [Trapelia coarctata]|nr:hypothetical protein [Trapelia coarctata]
MIQQQGVQITILAGAGGPEYECFETQGSRHSEMIRSEDGAQVCPRLTITSEFQWYEADLLSVEVHFGTAKALQPLRVAKPADGQELVVELDKWVVWSRGNLDWRDATFQFSDIEWDGDLEQPWSEQERLNFGIITISLQRMTLAQRDVAFDWKKISFESLLKIGADSPVERGVEQTIRILELSKVKRETWEKGSATRLDGKHGDCFRFKFKYKSATADWLRTYSKDPLEPLDYLTASVQAEETVEEIRKAAGEAGEQSAGKGRRGQGRRESSAKQPSNTAPRRPSGAKATEKRKAEGISTTATSTARSEVSSNLNEQGGDPSAPVFTMDPQVRAEKIRKLKEEDESLNEEILRRLQARQKRIREEIEELKKDG